MAMRSKPTIVTENRRTSLSGLGLAIADQSPLPMATTLGIRHTVSYVNPAFCRLLKKRKKQLIGKQFSALLPVNDPSLELLDRVFHTGNPENHTQHEQTPPHPVFWSYTMWSVSAGKHRVGVMLQVTETAQFHGKTIIMNEALVLGSLRQHKLAEIATTANAKLEKEIIERKEAEAALKESERRYRTLFDLVPMAVYSCDAKGMIQNFNRCAEQLWGRKPELNNRREKFCGSFKLFQPDGTPLPHRRCPMADVLSGKLSAVRDTEVCIQRPDGTRVTAIVNIRVLKNSRGEIRGAINCFYDITERKHAEAALRRIAVLAATNQKLELEISQRRTIQTALKQSEQQQRLLLVESRHMRDQLRLLSRQLMSAQEEERKRISRELHDIIGQTLTSINVRLATLKANASINTEEYERNIARTQQIVVESVGIVHQFARELRPTVLDDLGLIPALETFLKGFKEQTGIQVSLSAFTTVEEMNSDERTVFYRVAQEAITNVARHARASHVAVTLQKLASTICMTIKDNGVGFPAKLLFSAAKKKRLGLLGMRERLEMIGGTFAIEAGLDKGTIVTALVPLRKVNSRRVRPSPGGFSHKQPSTKHSSGNEEHL